MKAGIIVPIIRNIEKEIDTLVNLIKSNNDNVSDDYFFQERNKIGGLQKALSIIEDVINNNEGFRGASAE